MGVGSVGLPPLFGKESAHGMPCEFRWYHGDKASSYTGRSFYAYFRETTADSNGAERVKGVVAQ